MLAGGISEVVMHFIGYLNIIDDTARDRIEYESSYAPSDTPENSLAKNPFNQLQIGPDDIDINGVRGPSSITLDDLAGARLLHLKIPAALHPDAPDDFDYTPRLPPLPLPYPIGIGSNADWGPFGISATYRPGGEQTLMDVHQYNVLYNNDVIGDGSVSTQATALDNAADAVIQQMADVANAHIPQDWWMPQSSQGAIDFLTNHDQEWASANGAPEPNSVQPGYYLNGVLQTPAPDAPDQTALPNPPTSPELGNHLGQWADLGSNFSANAALVVDLTESGRTMVVMGDYFKTEAIFQTNSMVDQEHFSTVGGDALPAIMEANTINNIADFVQHPGVYASIPAYFAGPQWSVDVVNGNYYDVHAVVQTNYLSDNDIIAQQSTDTHYAIEAGGNTLENISQIFDGNINYDLIVVGGAYHGMNVIFQNNILLSEDQVRTIADGIAAEQSASGGGNNLTNEATIENYGGNNIQPTNNNLDSLTGEIAKGATGINPEYGNYFDGSGGVIHVLYVTGNYYDINAVWQTNVTSDVNVMAQLTGAPPEALVTALGQDGSVSQSITAGHNQLINDAAIIDVAPTNTYVGGQAYNDAILIQANLLPNETSPTLIADTHTLVPELVAFVTDSQESGHSQPATTTTVPAPHDDPVASVTH